MASSDLPYRSMTLDEFVPLVGATLHADCTPEAVALTLVSAKPARFAGDTDRPPFTLVFRSTLDAMLVDGIYRIQGAGFGPDLIAISSLTAPPNGEPGYYYQAVFN